MTDKKVLCKACSYEIANIKNNRLVLNNMKAVSIVEVDLVDNSKDIKCHQCANWNNFSTEHLQTINYKRKAADALYSQSNKPHKK